MSPVNDTTTVDDLSLEYDEEVEQRILGEVESATLPPKINDIVQDDGVLGDRKLFTWKWMWYVCGDMLTLDCVGDKHRQDAAEAKTLMALYTTLMDDIAEKLGDEATFWELAKTAYPESEPDWEREDIDSNYADSIRRVWTELIDHLESAPRFEEFEDPFTFNLRETVQAMEYTQMSDEYSAFMNSEEMWYFDTQGIGSFLFWTIDLMYSPSFEMDDFREFRQIVYELQHMWRLGNWVTTWELEIYEGDYSTGIIVEALNRGIIDGAELEQLETGEMSPERVIGRVEASGIVEQFVADWKRRRDALYQRDFGMRSLESDEMVRMMEQFMQSHLAIEKQR
ncbi:hypothetical protein [Halorussus caseinilyticus]|nr:hypothetical protein [Halorussus sp. DT72]